MREKVISLKEATEFVHDGSLLGLTSTYLEDVPRAFLQEMVRRGIKGLMVATLPGGGLGIDFLIGAGAVAEYETCHCSFGEYGPAPTFQRALRLQAITMKENT